jgi:hypothetical protein
MRDQNHGRAHFPAQVAHQIENLRLDGDVQSCRRLIRDQQFGHTGKRHRNHHALRHTAG